jgi:hypothetical protein
MKPGGPWIKMDDIAQTQSHDGMLNNAARVEEGVEHGRVGQWSSAMNERDGDAAQETTARRRPWAKKRKSYSHAHFKVYKRRWFGLAQLVLLNVVVSWDVSSEFCLVWRRMGCT